MITPTPPLEPNMEPNHLKSEASDLLHRELVNNFIVKSCLNCLGFDQKVEVCLFYVGSPRPPAPVIVFGCSSWELDIPF